MSIGKSVIFTGGVGDILAIESFMSQQERESIRKIYLATRAGKIVREIFSVVFDCEIETLWDDFSQRYCFHNIHEVVNALCMGKNVAEIRNILRGVVDYSIAAIFPQMDSRKFSGSGLLKKEVADISRFKLPDKYFVICPATINEIANPLRNFSSLDWGNALGILVKTGLSGVILNLGSFYIPQWDSLVDLSNQTTFLESVEILKKASGYIGVDSAISVLAAQLFCNLHIKCNNPHCYNYKHIYYAPQTNFLFMKRSIECG